MAFEVRVHPVNECAVLVVSSGRAAIILESDFERIARQISMQIRGEQEQDNGERVYVVEFDRKIESDETDLIDLFDRWLFDPLGAD